MKNILESLRPKQWTKNLFIFAGILFSQNILNLPLLLKAIFAFFIFCLLSGSIYILNDLTDLKQDRCHPAKSHRPLASGKLKICHAIITMVILTLFSLLMSYYLSPPFFMIALAYFLLQLAYSFFLKRIVILDVFTIACGFVLRVTAGAAAINVEVSSWLIICTILLSLFLGLSKRRFELSELKEEAQNHRESLAKYSSNLLDKMISAVSALTVAAYFLYTVSGVTIGKFGTRNLVFTVPFVLYGIFRYLYLIRNEQKGGKPEDILITDKPLMLNIILWIITVGIILYG